MSETWTVLLPATIDPSGPDELSDFASFVSISEYADEAALVADAGRFDAVITRTVPLTADFFDAADSLRVVVKHGAGVDHVDIDAATRNGVLVANTPGKNTNAVAEHALTLLLAAKRQVVRADAATRQADWRRHDFEGHELSGRTVGLVGAGNAGRRFAALLTGFGVSCVAYDPYVDPGVLPEHVELVESVRAVFEAADDASVHVPLTEDTRHVVGREELRLLPDDGVLVNTARGGVVDEAALVDALESGDIAGAGVDVYETEPPTADDPLLDRERAVFTQHNAGLTAEAARAVSLATAEHVRTVYEGGRPDTALNDPA
ncbi:hydroxyacid dehydrogenase [Salarchaeum japonicum]|uniref:D-3-phosphoglycerate dehydrogenase n=1 Tax=Salarchaeum japonicum TaxID=555573 RepID=A0AAV3T3V4_9EURY|nr:hydroxyacid dehydrogenase [Salarchaeum japonicum]